jgi:hypothetical protein
MKRLLGFLTVALFAIPVSARVIYVDNRVTTAGQGNAADPCATILDAERRSSPNDIIYVMETAQPYVENVVLQRGQQLLGSAGGVVDPPIAPLKGPGPEIHGTITTWGENVVAGCTIVADRIAGISAYAVTGTLTVRDVYFRTSVGGFAIFLQEQEGRVEISGGSITATANGSGLGFVGGGGEIVVDRCPISGDFTNVLRISRRTRGAITFKRGTKLTVTASGDGVDLSDIDRTAPVVFEDVLAITSARRAFVARHVAKLTAGSASTLRSVNAAALDVRDCGAELAFESVSAEGVAPGRLEDGIVLDAVRGHVAITGAGGKIGTGGSIAHARGSGIRVTQSSNVRIAGITLTDNGTDARIKGVRCAGGFEVVSTAICHAALYLRHVTDSTFEDIVVDGGGAMGLNANNVRDLTFTGLEIRRAGDATFESGALLQEVGGSVSFVRCNFSDNAGSELLIEQRFNRGRVVLDGCNFTAPTRPEVAKQLIEVHVGDGGKLDVDVRNGDLRDSIGYAVAATVAQSGELSLSISGSTLHHFGDGVASAAARDHSHLSFAARDNQIAAPAVLGHAWIDVTASDSAVACADIASNRFADDERGAGIAIRLAASVAAQLRVVGTASAEGIAAANGGATARLDAAASSVSGAASCR